MKIDKAVEFYKTKNSVIFEYSIRFCKSFCLRIWTKLCFDDDVNEHFGSVEAEECLDYETIG